jgi:hypothetical protein
MSLRGHVRNGVWLSSGSGARNMALGLKNLAVVDLVFERHA